MGEKIKECESGEKKRKKEREWKSERVEKKTRMRKEWERKRKEKEKKREKGEKIKLNKNGRERGEESRGTGQKKKSADRPHPATALRCCRGVPKIFPRKMRSPPTKKGFIRAAGDPNCKLPPSPFPPTSPRPRRSALREESSRGRTCWRRRGRSRRLEQLAVPESTPPPQLPKTPTPGK